MLLKYGINIENNAIIVRFTKLTNEIYKLLPLREEGGNWKKPLETILEELAGMNRLLIGQHIILFPLISKLEGLFTLVEEDDFLLYRRTIFECLSFISDLQKACQD